MGVWQESVVLNQQAANMSAEDAAWEACVANLQSAELMAHHHNRWLQLVEQKEAVDLQKAALEAQLGMPGVQLAGGVHHLLAGS